jgi:uncharacterized protein YndB with AHSA1/START domain
MNKRHVEPAGLQGGHEIVISRKIQAPRALVFKAWTSPQHVAVWWGPRGFRTTTQRIELRAGGVWQFTMHGPDGVDYLNRIEFLEVREPALLRYKQAGEGKHAEIRFHTTVTFDEADGATLVTLRNTFETAAALNYVVEKFGAIEGGKQHLERLSDHVTHQVPQTFTISRTFEAPRALVWKAWTEPERLAQWYGPKGCTLQVKRASMGEGGILHMRMDFPGGMEMWSKWVIREVMPPARLIFISCFSTAECGLGRHPLAPEWPQQMLTTISLEESDGRTTVTIRSTPIEESAAEREVFAKNHASMRGGWGGTLEMLAGYLEQDQAKA